MSPSKKDTHISQLHGAGGELMGELLERLILPRLGEDAVGRIGLKALDDGATIALPEGENGELVLTTDSHVVKPIFFPGGDIGCLAAAGTINDLAVMGARTVSKSTARRAGLAREQQAEWEAARPDPEAFKREREEKKREADLKKQKEEEERPPGSASGHEGGGA